MELDQLIDCFHDSFSQQYNVVLKGGFQEPYYQAATSTKPAEIQFRENFFRSALHEISHWCVAGELRRQKDDFGYWYEPDGRDYSQQLEFFQVEVLPQAFESIFCDALGIKFEVSLDNLGIELEELIDPIQAFKENIQKKKEHVLNSNAYHRARLFARKLTQHS